DRTVGRVLGRSRSPQQPLRARAALGEPLPFGLGGDLLEDLISPTRARDRCFAAQRLGRRLPARCELIEQLVNRRIDAAEEEARQGGDGGQRLTFRRTSAQTVAVGTGYRPVALR